MLRRGDAVMVSLTMRGDPDKAGDNVKPLQLQTDQVAKAHPELRVEQTGAGSLNTAVNYRVTKDLGRSETLSLPVTLVNLLVAFGAIIAAGVPVLLALTSVFAAIGLYGLASHVFPDNGSAGSLIMLMGMAVGVDYSLFYLKREREERRRGRGHIDAIEIAAATSVTRCSSQPSRSWCRWPGCTSSTTRSSPRSPPAASSSSRWR